MKNPVFLLPGQGSSSPGIFQDFILGTTIGQKWLGKAEFLSRKLGAPSIEPYLTHPYALFPYRKSKEYYTQQNLACLTLQVALAEALIAQGILPRALLGHSFGEFSSLVISGAVPFFVMYEFVYLRDLASGGVNEDGYLLAVQAESERIDSLLPGSLIANRNSPRQNVIALDWKQLTQAEFRLTEARIPFKRIESPQPYHSPAMEPACIRLREWFAGRALRFERPRIPVYSAGARSWVDRLSEENLRQFLCDQMIRPIDFGESLKRISETKPDGYLEIGFRNVLGSFVRSTLGNEQKVERVGRVLRAEKQIRKSRTPIKIEKSLLLDSVNKALKRITGYTIEDIALEDSFQEDLGMDSMQVTELVVEVLQKSGNDLRMDLGFRPQKTVGELLRSLEEAVVKGSLARDPGPEFAYCVRAWKEATLCPLLSNRAPRFVSLSLMEAASPTEVAKRLEEEKAKGLLIEVPEIEYRPEYESRILELLELWRDSLARNSWLSEISLAWVHRGASESALWPFLAVSRSLVREGLLKETRTFWVEGEHGCSLVEMVQEEFSGFLDSEVRRSATQRWVRHWETVNGGASLQPAVILIIGGARGIGLEIASVLSTRQPKALYLMGRSPLEEASVQRALQRLKQECFRVDYIQADASDFNDLKNAIERIREEQGAISLILNGAGSEHSQSFLQKSGEQMRLELQNKLKAAFHLSNLEPGALTVHHTSVVGRMGNQGQLTYALVNAWLDSFCQKRPNTISIQWPPWREVGMTVRSGAVLNLAGVGLLEAAKAQSLISHLPQGHCVLTIRDPADDIKYESPLKSLRSPWIDGGAVQGGRFCFRKKFDLKQDLYLEDHRVAGKAIVPAAVMLTQFFEAAMRLSSAWAELRDFAIQSPLWVAEAGMEAVLSSQVEADRMRLSLSTVIPHAVGYLHTGTLQKPAILKPRIGERIYSASEIYRFLFHGPRLRVLDSIWEAEQGYWAGLGEGVRTPLVEEDPCRGWVHSLDGAFQALGVLAWRETKKIFLPSGCKTLRGKGAPVLQPGDGISIRNLRLGEKEIEADVAFHAGECVWEMEGARMSETQLI